MTGPTSLTGRVPGDGPVRQANLRTHNLALVLRQIATGDRRPSRARIAAGTGLTRATVSALVDDLIDGGLVVEVEPVPQARAGRPGVGLALAADGPAGLGLEVNVDYLAACVVDLAGTVRHRAVQRADQRPAGPRASLDALARLAAAARADAEGEGLTLAGAAVAVPGLVAPDATVRLAPNLGWRDVDALGALRAHPALADLPLTIDNEANLAALGELHAGPPGPVSFLYISGEIGVGAGVVLDGNLYRGARGWSGELGHLPVRPEGPVCRCGARGCLEQYAGQEAILRTAGLLGNGDGGQDGAGHGGELGGGEHGGGNGGGEPALARLAGLAAAGDTAALRALTGAADALGIAVAGVINLLDVDTIVLGGGYTPLARWLRPGVQAEIERRVLTAAWSPIEVRASAWGAEAAVVGAAGAVVRSVRDDPARWLARVTAAAVGAQ